MFLYSEVLGHDLGWMDGIERAKRPERLPVVKDEGHPVTSNLPFGQVRKVY